MKTLVVDREFYSIYKIAFSDLDWNELGTLPRFHLSKTAETYSLIAAGGSIGTFQQEETDWRSLQIKGVIEFSEYGILEKLLRILAEERISVLMSSVFDTDYIYVKNECLPKATAALRKGGYAIEEEITV